ncbi:uncharacterized protein PV09_01218 [Verruconis gallopava]|uniref:Mitochondrial zinc maintenance protein 1, mitochondrial n=1 Tax=Verruconis gallopava TaxID=253628 RepID=A0A0D2AP23_9PEZI|nr:uncharacterized protein PV09_01218 [Verruconis gallopava]KIW08300.1 hypothetical protein PV09_01218 [Verruconis gallopava]
MALAVYRQLLRSTRIAFNGDTRMLLSARKLAREGFEANRSLSNPEEIQNAIQHAKDVGIILKQNVVQGKYDEANQRYKLNIHEHIERGDNETIKNPPPIIRGRNTLKNAKVGSLS